MTPKEKAEHIYFKMLKWQQDADIYLKRNIISTAAIRCALIAVDEILNSDPNNLHSEYDYNEYKLGVDVDYWTEVKKEIEKL
jgi:hypothetical protein